MTCRELLQHPVYCRVTDSPERALDIMKLTELSAVPVVSDHHDRKFHGLVHASTLLAAAAGGTLPAQVGELVQPADLVAHPEDDFALLSGEMTQRGLAALPVVDAEGRLAGILMPGGTVTPVKEHAAPCAGRKLPVGLAMAGLAGAAAGAGLMYLLDPNRGRARRAGLLSRTTGLLHRAGDAIEHWEHHLANRALGVKAGVKARAEQLFEHEAAPDEKVQARVRSALGHLVAHPRQVEVKVKNGSVALSGNLEAEELARLEAGVGQVKGVHAVAVAGPRL